MRLLLITVLSALLGVSLLPLTFPALQLETTRSSQSIPASIKFHKFKVLLMSEHAMDKYHSPYSYPSILHDLGANKDISIWAGSSMSRNRKSLCPHRNPCILDCERVLSRCCLFTLVLEPHGALFHLHHFYNSFLFTAFYFFEE